MLEFIPSTNQYSPMTYYEARLFKSLAQRKNQEPSMGFKLTPDSPPLITSQMF